MRLCSTVAIANCMPAKSARIASFSDSFMSAPPGNGCVGASILPREAAGTFSPSINKNPIKEA